MNNEAQIETLQSVLPALSGSDATFAQSLLNQYAQRGLSNKQWPWVGKLVERAGRGPRPAAVSVGNLKGVLELFDRAKQHLKMPAVVLSVPAMGEGATIRVYVAGQRARLPGTLTVVDGERSESKEQRDWYGRIYLDGVYKPSDTAGRHAPAIVERLRAFAADPAGVAAEHGKLTGRCCFCNIALDKAESTAVGYGRTCAKNYGLPWGKKKVAALSCDAPASPQAMEF